MTPSQDGGEVRHTVPPHTTKRRTTTDLKTKNNQNCQKVELYGSLTTKELKKKQSSRLVGGVEMGNQAERTLARRQLVDRARWQLAEQAVPHLCADKAAKALTEKSCGG